MAAMFVRYRLETASEAVQRLEAIDGEFWGPEGRASHPTHKVLRDIATELTSEEYTERSGFAASFAASIQSEGHGAWRRWGQPSIAIRDCATTSKVLRCKTCTSDKAFVLVPVLCLSRYCPTCCVKNRARTQRRLRAILGRFKNRPRFLTLTVKSSHDLNEARDRLLRAWAKFRSRAWVRRMMRGGFAVLEVTYNPQTGWHPHLHIAFDGVYMHHARMVDEWMSCCTCSCYRGRASNRKPVLCCLDSWEDRDGRYRTCTDPACTCTGSYAGPAGQFIKVIDAEAAVRELGKYLAKELGEASPNLPKERLIEFLRLTWGRRTLYTFGTHFDPTLEALEEEIRIRAMRDEYDGDPRCPLCDSTDLHQMGIRACERAPPAKEERA